MPGNMSGAIQIPQEMNDDTAASHPRLIPRIHPQVKAFLDDRALVHDLVRGFGSPLNIVFPDIIPENIKSFADIYRKHMLRGRIHVTSKPCKSKSLMRRASLEQVGADVSSVGSLHHVLGCGFQPERIEATGPKNADYVLTCLQLDVLLNVDSPSELALIEQLCNQTGLKRKVRIMVRLQGFSSPRVTFTPQDSTFGIHVRDIPALLDYLVMSKDIFDFRGFSFHLTDSNPEQKRVALENALELTFAALKKGLKPTAVDIGGGFAIQYADDPAQYAAYVESLKKSVLGKLDPQIWNGSGLGFKDHNGVVVGGAQFMDHAPARTKGDELDHLLMGRSPQFGNTSFADIIRDSLLELVIEPGRAMFDQCGVTLGRVAFTKESQWGEKLVGLEMNRSNIHSVHIKNLCEPVHVPRDPQKNNTNNKGVYYNGNLCLAYDMIQYTKTYPALLPLRGDVVAFINTAPYIMDFNESETLMQPVAEKIAVWDEDKKLVWSRDQNYLPVNPYED